MALLVPLLPLRGQQQPTIAVETKIVTVFATVRDKHGAFVPTLNRDDFILQQDGQPQPITYFAREKDVPLIMGLLVDTSRSQQRVLGKERSASYSFLDHLLRDDKDQAFVLHFDREVELLQDLTSSRKKLESALNLLDAPELQRAGDEDGGQRRAGGGTLLYDAVYLASNDLMKKPQGQKALVILSDGVDRGSKESLKDAIEAAQRANTVVYSILFKEDQSEDRREHGGGGWGGRGGGYPGGGYPGGGYPGGGRGGGGYPGGGSGRYPQQERTDGKKILDRISKETGGRLFEVSKKLTVDDIYSQISDELRNQYILGYTPQKDQSGRGYHKIQLTTKSKDLTVQAREGYYGEP